MTALTPTQRKAMEVKTAIQRLGVTAQYTQAIIEANNRRTTPATWEALMDFMRQSNAVTEAAEALATAVLDGEN